MHQLLVYPVASGTLAWPSVEENANAKPLNKAMLPWFFKNYLKSPADSAAPQINLVGVSNLQGLPAATIILAQIDPLRSEGDAYAKELKDAGVEVDEKTYDGVTHEFFGMGAAVDEAKDAVRFAADGLKKGFGGATTASR